MAQTPDSRLSSPLAECPCSSGRRFADCCGPYLAGSAEAPTAEALMRSRYSAYALHLDAYVLTTWHAETCPGSLYAEQDVRPVFTGLQVLEVKAGQAGDREGWVSFEARFETPEGAGVMRERSRFIRVDGQWRYVRGQALPTPAAAAMTATSGRNQPCPCGSGKKAKHCCLA